MERVKVLSAALALGEFTVAELSSLSGVKANSVRSVLNRNPHFVHRIGSARLGRRGHPSTQWAIADSDASRRLAAELDALVATDPRGLPSIDEQQSVHAEIDRREVAVTIAERALAQVIDEQDFVGQQEIIASAQASLRYADDNAESDAEPHWWHDDPSALAARARGVDALATLAATPQQQLSEELLEQTASDVAAAMDTIPAGGDSVYFAPFSQILAAHETLAPVLWLSDRGEPPSEVSHQWSALHTTGVDLDDAFLHTQSWAAPLVGVAPLPMLLSSAAAAPDEKFVKSILERTRTIPRPTFVLGHARQIQLVRIAARWGASFVPIDWESLEDFQSAIYAVAAAIDRYAAPNLVEVATAEADCYQTV